MDSNSSQNEELYRAAVGESKAGYYLPLFERFDQGGSRVSWNWPAFFVPFFWMLYRRMYGLAAAYFFLYPFAAAILLAVLTAVLGQAAAALAYWLVILGVWVLVPMFANSLYHAHVRKRIDRMAGEAPSHEALVQRLIGQSSGNTAVVVAIVAVGGVTLVGILAAIAIPAYQDYTIRAQVSEGLALADQVKASVAAAYAATGHWPPDLQGTQTSSHYVTSVDVSDGVILISYGKTANRQIAGHTLSLHPGVEGDRVVAWACGYAAGDAAQTDIAPKYLPSACRAPPAERL
ncbi:MAG TPA: pilin [Steroidobacteraceae bacterium]|nr:pilin [Steroidobacteraceae bacterium]